MKNLITISLKLSFIAFALTLSVDASAIGHSSNKKNTVDVREQQHRNSIKKVYAPINIQLSQKKKVRSRSDAIREVKSRYNNAEVLRIKLNEKSMVYQVRVLMPNGKVKNVTVSATR